MNICARCDREVFFAEQKLAIGKVWHCFCFSCCMCRKLLDSCTVYPYNGELYCTACYRNASSTPSLPSCLRTRSTPCAPCIPFRPRPPSQSAPKRPELIQSPPPPCEEPQRHHHHHHIKHNHWRREYEQQELSCCSCHCKHCRGVAVREEVQEVFEEPEEEVDEEVELVGCPYSCGCGCVQEVVDRCYCGNCTPTARADPVLSRASRRHTSKEANRHTRKYRKSYQNEEVNDSHSWKCSRCGGCKRCC